MAEKARDPKTDAYTAAQKTLRETYRTEYNALVAKEMAARGVEWKPKPTEAEKAAAQVEKILRDYPDLRAQFQSPPAQ